MQTNEEMTDTPSAEALIARYRELKARQEADNTDKELYEETLEAAREAAAAGDADAQYVWALHLFDLRFELATAAQYCARAALKGHEGALAELREQYRHGGAKLRRYIEAALTQEQIAQLKLKGLPIPRWMRKLLCTLLSLACAFGAACLFVAEGNKAAALALALAACVISQFGYLPARSRIHSR